MKNDEVRSGISILGFWSTDQVEFLDIRISNPNATRYINKSIVETYETNEREKKRKHNQRIQGVKHGSFALLVFSLNAGMGRELSRFYKRLSALVSVMRHYSFLGQTRSVLSYYHFRMLACSW